MTLRNEESDDANGRGLEAAAAASKDIHDTDDDEDVVSLGSSSRATLALSPSSGEALPHERPEN